jgi:FMN reductase
VSRTVVIVGNPKPASRTRVLAEEVAAQVTARAGWTGADGDIDVIDLADHTGGLFDWSSADVATLVERVLAAGLLVVASPTYKATYTGLLKVFLERFGRDQLAGVPAVAVMTGGRDTHALAVEHALRPLLVEIGASVPTRGLYVVESDLEDPAVPVKAWLDEAGDVLARALVR